MSWGRDRRWSPSLIRVKTTSLLFSARLSSSAWRHGTSSSAPPCRMRTGGIDRDRAGQDRPARAVLEQLGGDRIAGGIVRRRPRPDAVPIQRRSRLRRQAGLQQGAGEVGGGGDQHQGPHALRSDQRRQAREPSAHRRAHQDQRPLGQPIHHRQGVAAPAGDRSVREVAAGFAVTEVVEAQKSPTASLGPRRQRVRLGSGHVRAEAAEPDHRRPRAADPAPGEFRAVVLEPPAGPGHSRPLRRRVKTRVVPTTLPPGFTLLQVVPRLVSGGVELATADMATAVVAAGHRSLVACHGGADVEGEVVDLPVHSRNPVVMAANVGRLTRLIQERGVSLVHVRSRAPAFSAIGRGQAGRGPGCRDLPRHLFGGIADQALVQRRDDTRRPRDRQLRLHARPHPGAALRRAGNGSLSYLRGSIWPGSTPLRCRRSGSPPSAPRGASRPTTAAASCCAPRGLRPGKGRGSRSKPSRRGRAGRTRSWSSPEARRAPSTRPPCVISPPVSASRER